MTKFNQKMYAKMRARKNEPLLSLGKKVVWVVENGTPITLVTFVLEAMKAISPATSVEEITPRPKRQRIVDKGKEKVGFWSLSIWDNTGLALMRAQDAFTVEDLKAFSSIHSNEIVSHHIHKLIQVMYTYHTFFLLCCGLAHEVEDFMFYIISFSGAGKDDPHHV